MRVSSTEIRPFFQEISEHEALPTWTIPTRAHFCPAAPTEPFLLFPTMSLDVTLNASIWTLHSAQEAIPLVFGTATLWSDASTEGEIDAYFRQRALNLGCLLDSLQAKDGSHLDKPSMVTVFYLLAASRVFTPPAPAHAEAQAPSDNLDICSHVFMTSLMDPDPVRQQKTQMDRQRMLETLHMNALPPLPPHLHAALLGNWAATIPMVLASQWCGEVQVRTLKCRKLPKISKIRH
jgi:hypothetical protein